MLSLRKIMEVKVYVFNHHSTQTMIACIVSGTGLFAYVPEEMMKRY